MNKKSSLEKNGFVEFLSDPAKFTIDIAACIGTVLHLDDIPRVQTLVSSSEENATKNTYSGNFGFGTFPLHTDLAHWHIPPRYILLRCITPVAQVATNIILRDEFFKNVDENDINCAHFKPRKKIGRNMFLLKLSQDEIFRWDSVFLEPANKAAERVKRVIEKENEVCRPRKVFLREAGDCVLLDNWRVVHGRERIEQGDFRRIERVYISEVKL